MSLVLPGGASVAITKHKQDATTMQTIASGKMVIAKRLWFNANNWFNRVALPLLVLGIISYLFASLLLSVLVSLINHHVPVMDASKVEAIVRISPVALLYLKHNATIFR